ncbi:MAG: hypothetical protein JHD02_09500 [Thermoleophilaceae bacterium]|nr:hypothetical protein [Thermoleophilaceae bacterium]
MVFFTFNLVFLALFLSTILEPADYETPGLYYGFSAFFGIVAFACLFLTARSVRVAVWIDDDRVCVRNYVTTYSVKAADVVEFSYGYPQARMQGYEQAGSLKLKDGSVRPVVAISRGTWLTSGPMRSGAALLDDLNSAVHGEASERRHLESPANARTHL